MSGNGGDAGLAPSCAPGGPGMSNCGASNENCCMSMEVSGGTYYRTYTNSGSGPMGEADQAKVSTFRLDKYLVTVGRFRQFVSAWNGGLGWTPPAGSGKHTYLSGGRGLTNSASPGTYEQGWVASDDGNVAPSNNNLDCDPAHEGTLLISTATWTDSVGNNESLPINCITWQEAYAFCIWDGGFLPSEAEWEYAASGGQHREYPWGSTDPGTGDQYAIYNCDYPPNGAGACDTAPVGTATLGAGFWGQLDMSGEVFEWTLDSYADYVDPCANCAYFAAASDRADRGGSFGFGSNASYLLPSSRHHDAPTIRFNYVGFRCARAP
jgi:formylglycine-generating enzyme